MTTSLSEPECAMSEEHYISMAVSKDSDDGLMDGNVVLDLCNVSNGVSSFYGCAHVLCSVLAGWMMILPSCDCLYCHVL